MCLRFSDESLCSRLELLCWRNSAAGTPTTTTTAARIVVLPPAKSESSKKRKPGEIVLLRRVHREPGDRCMCKLSTVKVHYDGYQFRVNSYRKRQQHEFATVDYRYLRHHSPVRQAIITKLLPVESHI